MRLLICTLIGLQQRQGGWEGVADAGTCVHAVVGFQLVLEAELLPAAVTFVGLLPGVDALVALQRALVPEAAPAELALVRVVPSWKVEEMHRLLWARCRQLVFSAYLEP